MSYNPLSEVKYRYRLAVENLERAERSFSARDWVGTVSASQLAVENSAKAVIAIFEVPTWNRGPSNQLEGLAGRLPNDIMDSIRGFAGLAGELAPEHGRSTYGEPAAGLVPSDIYRERHALDALEKARKAKGMAERVFRRLNIEF